MTEQPRVAIIMGSRSDWPTMKGAAECLDALGVAYRASVISAHRTPHRLYAFAAGARDEGYKVIVAGAGGAAHLPGMTASMTPLPVLGVPTPSKALNGLDSLLSIVQMPAGVPVATLAIGEAGARNAGLLAAQILALSDAALAERIDDYRRLQSASVPETVEDSPGGVSGWGRPWPMTDFPLAPGATIGILGGGQLGRMLAMAAARLGFDTAILTPEAEFPAARVAAHAIVAAYDDPAALRSLADLAQVITFEFENVPASALAELERLGASVAPNGRALEVAQDRWEEKSFLNAAGIATVGFASIDSEADLRGAFKRFGPPLLLKTRRGGYDGKGQAWAHRPADGPAALATLGGRPAIAETPADFRREVALIAARGRDGEIALYPLTESHHENGILRRTSAPAAGTPKLFAEAEKIAATLLAALDYVGVLGVEMFERDDGRLLVNEFAPRVHNTGHWTLDGCEVDQFEQHIRAIAGWPLGPTAANCHVEMTNLLGDEAGGWARLAREPETRVWLYGKREPAPGRKMGHVNRLSSSRPG